MRRTAAASFFYVLRSLRKELVAVMEAGMTTPFDGIETLWMTRCGSERIFLADGPGLLRLQDRGYRVLRLVSHDRTVSMRLSGTSKRASAQRER